MPAVTAPLSRVETLGCELAGELGRVDTTGFDVAQLERARRFTRRLRGIADAFDIDLARRATQLRPAGGSHDVDQAMNPDGQAPAGKEKTDTTRGEVADAIPGFDDAVRDGTLGAEYLDTVARARNKLSETDRRVFDEQAGDLAAVAGGMSLHQFKLHVADLADRVQADQGAALAARQHRARSARQWDDVLSGMHKLFLQLDPETGARVHDAVHAQVERLLRERRDNPTDTRSIEQVTADAIVELILNGNQHLRPGSTELVVLIDYLTLTHGLHDTSVHETWDGTHLSPDVIRRIACDTHLIPILLGGPGQLLDAGRRTRTANREQRRALRAIYRTCAIDRCTTAYHRCEIHHITPWWHHGDTNFDNLIPLCARHHHMIHETGWHLTLNPTNRQLTITHPNGRITIQPPPPGLTPPQPAATRNGTGTGTGDSTTDDPAPDATPGRQPNVGGGPDTTGEHTGGTASDVAAAPGTAADPGSNDTNRRRTAGSPPTAGSSRAERNGEARHTDVDGNDDSSPQPPTGKTHPSPVPTGEPPTTTPPDHRPPARQRARPPTPVA